MDLVLQGPALATPEIASIASLAGAQGIHALAGGSAPAFRLTRIERREGVAERCAAAGIDHAFVPPDLARDRVCVVAMDMDSTLITIECIDEIARLQGIDTDESRAEIARCEANLKLSSATRRGFLRVAIARHRANRRTET